MSPQFAPFSYCALPDQSINVELDEDDDDDEQEEGEGDPENETLEIESIKSPGLNMVFNEFKENNQNQKQLDSQQIISAFDIADQQSKKKERNERKQHMNK